MTNPKSWVPLCAVALLCGCASSSQDIATTYVSPLVYEDYNCKQIGLELDRVSHRVSALGGQIDEKAGDDAAVTGIGLILFWPALFFIDGDGPESYEYARLKGEYEALEKTAVKKECSVEFRDVEAERRMKKKEELEEIENKQKVNL